MASMNKTSAQDALAQAIKQQVMDKLEQTLDIVIPAAMRNQLLKATPTGPAAPTHARLRPTQPAVNAPTGHKCAAIWQELDKRAAAGKETSLEEIRTIGEKKRWNENTTRIQYYRWRHARGL